MYMYVCVRDVIHVHVYRYMCVYVYMYMYMCMSMCMYVCERDLVHVHVPCTMYHGTVNLLKIWHSKFIKTNNYLNKMSGKHSKILLYKL